LGADLFVPKLWSTFSFRSTLINISGWIQDEFAARTFSAFPDLQTLISTSNYLSFIHPDAFDGTQLDYLDLSQNALTSLPNVNLPLLTTLIINNNPVTALDMVEIAVKFPKLEKLEITHSSIEFLIGIEAANAASLQMVNLFKNKIATIPSDFLTGASAVWSLQLAANKLTSFPCSAVNGTNLGSIYLYLNQLTEFPDPSCVGSTLKQVYMGFNQITSLDPKVIRNLPLLTRLDLKSNQITCIHKVILHCTCKAIVAYTLLFL
jgi:hypothetical protein